VISAQISGRFISVLGSPTKPGIGLQSLWQLWSFVHNSEEDTVGSGYDYAELDSTSAAPSTAASKLRNEILPALDELHKEIPQAVQIEVCSWLAAALKRAVTQV
jgi:hypothetical protein